MAKASKRKTAFFCQECGADSAKWQGKCPGCGAWNTMVEELVPTETQHSGLSLGLSEGQDPLPISALAVEEAPRFATGSSELDRVLGGGVLPGSITLVAGDPGIGKSSLTIKVCADVAAAAASPVLYVTGEESARQIKLRADRLQAIHEQLYVLSETNLEKIEQQVLKLKPSFLVIDSIQTIFRPDIQSAPGSISQVRECAVQLLRLAKVNSIAVFLIGHVLKDGSLAGPRALEHIVDTVLFFEGDRNGQYRVLRAVKNRFGSTNEIGLFEMRNEGLIDVPDASKIFLSERPLHVPGSIVVPTIEGTRPLLVEVQALVSASPFMPPRRTADCVDIKRIQLLLAVLEKRVGMAMGTCDVYVKVAGSIKIDEPAVDLGLIAALASSFHNKKTAPQTLVFGEVGLAGEIRAVTQAEARIREGERMGFKRIVLPKTNLKGLPSETGIELIGVEQVRDALPYMFV